MAAPAPRVADARVSHLLRPLLPLAWVTVLAGLTGAFVSPYLPLFLSRTLHADPVQVATFLFLTPLSAIVIAIVLGRLSDWPGMRHRILIAAAGAGGLGFTLFAVMRNYWGLLGVAVTFVAVAGSLMAQIFAYGRQVIDRGDPNRAALGISALRTLLSLAWVAGPPLGALLIAGTGFRGLFLATAAGYLVMLAVLLIWRWDAGTATRSQAGPDPMAPHAPSGAGVATITLLGTVVAFVSLQCAATLGAEALPLFLNEDLHRGVSDAGLVLGLCAALEIPLMLLSGALASRWPLRRLMLLGGGFGVAYYAVVSISDSVWQVAAAQVLNAGFIACATGLGISYVQDLMPGLPGRATTMFTNSNRIGAMLAGPLLGVAQHYGYRLAYGVGAGLCVTGLVLLALTRVPTVRRPAVLLQPVAHPAPASTPA